MKYAQQTTSPALKYIALKYGVIKLIQTYIKVCKLPSYESLIDLDTYEPTVTHIQSDKLVMEIAPNMRESGFLRRDWACKSPAQLDYATQCADKVISLLSSQKEVTEADYLMDMSYDCKKLMEAYRSIAVKYIPKASYEYIFDKINIFEFLMNSICSHIDDEDTNIIKHALTR